MGNSKTLLFAGLVGLSATLTAQAQTPLPGMPAVKIENSAQAGFHPGSIPISCDEEEVSIAFPAQDGKHRCTEQWNS